MIVNYVFETLWGSATELIYISCDDKKVMKAISRELEMEAMKNIFVQEDRKKIQVINLFERSFDDIVLVVSSFLDACEFQVESCGQVCEENGDNNVVTFYEYRRLWED